MVGIYVCISQLQEYRSQYVALFEVCSQIMRARLAETISIYLSPDSRLLLTALPGPQLTTKSQSVRVFGSLN